MSDEDMVDAGSVIAGHFDEGVRGYGGLPYFDGVLHHPEHGIFWQCLHGHIDADSAEGCAEENLAQWGLAELRSQGGRW